MWTKYSSPHFIKIITVYLKPSNIYIWGDAKNVTKKHGKIQKGSDGLFGLGGVGFFLFEN